MRFNLCAAIIAASLVSLLAACSKPSDTVIPSDMSSWDTKLAPVMEKLSEEDRVLASGYLVRLKMREALSGKDGIPAGTTLGQAIEEQRKWVATQKDQEAEEAALKEKVQKEREQALARISQAVTVTLIEKGTRSANFQAGRLSDQQTFRIGVKNKSDKALKGVAGSLVFIDIFDKQVGRVSFKVAETIPPGQVYVWEGARDYNQFIPEEKAVWNLEEGKYRTIFEPDTLVYDDGTKLVADAQ
jgi:hypothetical protein